MRRLVTTAALMALCGVAFGAISVAGASAATTAYTCLPGGNGFADADCSTAGNGFHDEAIAEGLSTGLWIKTVTANQILKTEIFGAELEVLATGVECIECMVENTTVGAEMEVKGENETLRYSGVTVGGALAAACEVKTGVIKTKPLKFTANAANSASIKPEAGLVFEEFELLSKAGHVCGFNGVVVKVEGAAPPAGPIARGAVAGARLTFNTVEGELSVSGEPAFLTGTVTLSTGVTGAEQHPMVLTP